MKAPDDWQLRGIESLEPAAWKALRHGGNICVVAGPGAGKTEFLAQKAAYLLETGLCRRPRRILAISFKRDAAENLRRRVRARCSQAEALRFQSLTFDTFTKSLVDRFFLAIPTCWRPASDYKIIFPKKQDYAAFLARARSGAPPKWQADIAALSEDDFESHVVGTFKLNDAVTEPTNGEEFAVQRWFVDNIQSTNGCFVTFTILNRLAELLLRCRPPILRALRATYRAVFVDEFQDTTFAQYDFLLTAFGGSQAAVTAVGDDKQRIMVWAGARPDAFSRFQQDFGGGRIQLRFNYRSSPGLVRIQQVVAKALDAKSAKVVSKVKGQIAGDVAAIRCFNSEVEEANWVAGWIRDDQRARGLKQRDYAVLVRQTVDVFERQLMGSFASAGLKLRNEARQIGRTTLQDLLAEEVTRVVGSFIRLACQRRAPKAWSDVSTAFASLRGVDPDDAAAVHVNQVELKKGIAVLRRFLNEEGPSPIAAATAVQKTVEFLTVEAFSRAYPQYSTGDDLARAVEAMSLYFGECAVRSKNWLEAIDSFDGVDQVPLMTVHKSKGLEYDTVLFLGLDDNTWWSHRPGNYEGLATFFVALSRAKQRAIFTYCRGRGTRFNVSDLYDLLTSAGVPSFGP